MTSTVSCPECHRPATVLDRFMLAGTRGPVEYLRIRCSGLLSVLVAADEVHESTEPALVGASPAA